MSKFKMIRKRYVHDKLDKVTKALQTRDNISEKVQKLRTNVVNDIITGWGTGDVCTDFAVVAAGGVYRKELVQAYQALQQQVWRHVGEQILVIQQAELIDCEVVILTKFCVAEIRRGHVEFDVNKQRIGIPVKPTILVHQSSMVGSEYHNVTHGIMSSHIHVGPLISEENQIGKPVQEGEVLLVPFNAPCDLQFRPWNLELLTVTYGFDRDMLNYLTGEFVLKKTHFLKDK